MWIWFIWMEEIIVKIYENFILYINFILYFKRDVFIFILNNLMFREVIFIEEFEMFIEWVIFYFVRLKIEFENNF